MADQTNPAFTDPLLNRFFISPQEKLDKEKGKAIVKGFYTRETANDGLSYFKQRNARWIEILLWAKGSQNMREFLDYMNVSDGNKAYVNMDTTQQRIATQFIGTLVTALSKNKTYPCVKAIDTFSMQEKEERQLEALFRMKEVETINELQQQAGIQLEPDNVYVPENELAARVHFELEDRLPKEIRFEQILSNVQKQIQFERVINQKGLYDMITLNFEATRIEKKGPKQYIPRKCIPTNCVYNFFMNDTGDCEVTMFGEFYNVKVKDFRSKYGKSEENPNGLTEEQIYNIAKLSTTQNNGKFNWLWEGKYSNISFNININRPYDDCSILVFDTLIDCREDVYYVSKKDSFGKEDIQVKKSIPYQQVKKDGTIIQQEKPEDVEILKSERQSWMNGVYCPYGDTMLAWKPCDIIIPNWTDNSKSLAPVTINIPMNDGEYVPSLFERCMEPLREYSITKLKRKQLIAGLVPHGIRIDVETARNIDLGNGDTIAWEEVVRIYQQTGNEIWSSKGVDPLKQEAPPLSNTVHSDAIQEIIGLTNILQSIVGEIRMLIGASVYLEGGEVGDRTSGKLAESQLDQAPNVFGFVANGHKQLWQETYYKICLLHWNDVVKEEPESKDDLINTRFEVSIDIKDVDYEKQLIERDIDRYSQIPDKNGNPSLTPKDARMIRNIDDYKLQCLYLTDAFEENRKKAIEDSQRLQKENAEVQQKSATLASEQAAKLQEQKLAEEKDMVDFKSTKEKELAILTIYGQIAAKGLPIPEPIAKLMELFYPNIAMPLAVENDNMEKGMQAEAAQEQMQAMQQQQMAQQGQQQDQMQQQQFQQPQMA